MTTINISLASQGGPLTWAEVHDAIAWCTPTMTGISIDSEWSGDVDTFYRSTAESGFAVQVKVTGTADVPAVTDRDEALANLMEAADAVRELEARIRLQSMVVAEAEALRDEAQVAFSTERIAMHMRALPAAQTALAAAMKAVGK